MRFCRKWKMAKWTAVAFAGAAIGAPSAMAMPVTSDGPGYGEDTQVSTTSSGGGFDWTYVEAGLGAALGLVVVAGGTAVVIRRNGHPRLLGA
jgi:hypothetical protein